MITPEEIRTKALKWWNDSSFLQAYLSGADFFPKGILFGKISTGETIQNFDIINRAIKLLKARSKDQTGFGYRIDFTEKKTQKLGRQLFPTRIYFEDREDYLKFIKKENEFSTFVALEKQIQNTIPDLKSWVYQYPLKVIQQENNWLDLLKVCHYYLLNNKPDCYIRELPIAVHTKFIEENKTIISELLNHLLPHDAIQLKYTGLRNCNFEKRYHLRYDETLLRFRILDPSLYIHGLSDLSVLPSEFELLNIPCHRVFITENKMNCLTFPAVAKAIVIFGTGYGVKKLKATRWLHEKEILYWGDIDAHGFEILSQLRSYFPQTISFLMDRDTFQEFYQFACMETFSSTKNLRHLGQKEQEMYKFLRSSRDKNRLEQEKIDQQYVNNALKNLIRSL